MTDFSTVTQLYAAQNAGNSDRALYALSAPSFLAAILLIFIIILILIFTDIL